MRWLDFLGKKKSDLEDPIVTITPEARKKVDSISKEYESGVSYLDDIIAIIIPVFRTKINSLSEKYKSRLTTPETITTKIQTLFDESSEHFRSTNVQIVVITISCSASFLLGFKVGRVRPFWQRLTSVQDIPSSYFGPTASMLRGKVVTVSDGDTFRFLHTPTIFHFSRIPKGEKISSVALPIRLCTIDTPETAKFGKPGQPFGDDAKQKLHDLMQNKRVSIRLLHKDQFGRAVAEVRTGIWPFYKYLDEQMLRFGLAEVYQGGGAVYGYRGKKAYLAFEEKARSNKLGVWSQKERESAAAFKARMKAEG